MLQNLILKKNTEMSNMFCEYSHLTSIDLSKFNPKNVTIITEMFYSCDSLKSIELTNLILKMLLI